MVVIGVGELCSSAAGEDKDPFESINGCVPEETTTRGKKGQPWISTAVKAISANVHTEVKEKPSTLGRQPGIQYPEICIESMALNRIA